MTTSGNKTFKDEVEALLQDVILAHIEQDVAKVDRFEVIDGTGRAYVKGSIYGSPVSIKLSYQDDGHTLKVFVTELTAKKRSSK